MNYIFLVLVEVRDKFFVGLYDSPAISFWNLLNHSIVGACDSGVGGYSLTLSCKCCGNAQVLLQFKIHFDDVSFYRFIWCLENM